ncbi:MAG: hypothetical protein AB7I45_01455 [Planctomycetota bacterium]
MTTADNTDLDAIANAVRYALCSPNATRHNGVVVFLILETTYDSVYLLISQDGWAVDVEYGSQRRDATGLADDYNRGLIIGRDWDEADGDILAALLADVRREVENLETNYPEMADEEDEETKASLLKELAKVKDRLVGIDEAFGFTLLSAYEESAAWEAKP